jgi:hypothetical protein
MIINTFIRLLLVLVAITPALAQREDNVLSYYAANNTLDGQPIIEMRNVLRFYPVFAMRRETDSVRVTVYYGPHVFTRLADKRQEGQYWEVLLPEFELGEAIQRIDVETAIDFGENEKLRKLARDVDDVERSLARLKTKLTEESTAVSTAINNSVPQLQSDIREQLRSSTLPPTPVYASLSVDVVPEEFNQLPERVVAQLGTSPDCPTAEDLTAALTAEVGRIKGDIETSIAAATTRSSQQQKSAYEEFVQRKIEELPVVFESAVTGGINTIVDRAVSTAFKASMDELESSLNHLVASRNALLDAIIDDTYRRLADQEFSGPSVLRSDIVLVGTTRARVLYRNYKTSLRSMRALDPAEYLGVFRLRYVPFVVVGGRFDPTFTDGSNAVFEVGLAFTDVAVPGDEFVRPELSLGRLGVAFAITRDLFKSTAEVRALALTYDFNAYGSLGVGANFKGEAVESYFSFGINRRAFEDVLGALAGVFE